MYYFCPDIKKMPNLRRSSRQRKVSKAFEPASTLRQRGTGQRLSKKNNKEAKQHLPHGNILGEREIRIAARQRLMISFVFFSKYFHFYVFVLLSFYINNWNKYIFQVENILNIYLI